MSVTAAPATRARRDPADRHRLLRRVEARITRLLESEWDRWASVDSRATPPVAAISRLVEAGGKRIRPAFCLTGYLAAGGDPDDAPAVSIAAALELLHACALLHDDVMDDSPLRRGAPTAHARHEQEHRDRGWAGEARRYGESVAVLAGDLALVYSDLLVAEAEGWLPPARAAGVRRIWDEARSELIVGQFLDTAAAAQGIADVALARWIAVCKSGAYTIERPLALGAVAAGRPDLVEPFRRYGLAVGEAFQLRDDLLDLEGDAAVVGKPTGHDQQQHKMNLLMTLARQRGRDHDDGVHDDGVRDQVEVRIAELLDDARTALDDAPLDDGWRRDLADLAHRVAYRDR